MGGIESEMRNGRGAIADCRFSSRRQLRRGAGSFTFAPFFRRRRICQNINAVLPAATAASQGQRLGASSLSTRSSCRRVLSVAGSPSKCRSSTTSSNSDVSASAVRFVELKNRAVFQGMLFQGMSSGLPGTALGPDCETPQRARGDRGGHCVPPRALCEPGGKCSPVRFFSERWQFRVRSARRSVTNVRNFHECAAGMNLAIERGRV